MTDDIEERIARGKRANALLSDPLLAEAFAAVVKGYYADWLKTAKHEAPKREELFMAAYQIGEVRQKLINAITDGQIAEREAEQDQNK